MPVYKKDDRHCPANYRPVSLTSASCKLLEHIIYKHVMRHCETHGIIVDIQQGFRSGRSCESQLITAREEIAAWRDKGHNVDVLIMDFSQAFDKVPHQRLLSKLEHYGVTDNLWNWIQHWLTTRTQTVDLEGMASQPVKVKSGVPQGTVLGPLMFCCTLMTLMTL